MEHELHRKLISLKVLQDTRRSVTKWVRKVLCPMDTFCLLQQFSESSARWHALWLSKVSMANALVFLRFWPWTFWQNSFYGLVFQWSTLCYILYQTFSYQGGYRCEIKMWTMSSNVRGCQSIPWIAGTFQSGQCFSNDLGQRMRFVCLFNSPYFKLL